MSDSDAIAHFESSWGYMREMTNKFITCVPDDKFSFAHHEKFAPLIKQFKHMAKVYGCYVDAMAQRTLDMSKKKSMFTGEESRENVLSTLERYDRDLERILTQLKASGLENSVDVFGMKMSFSEFTHVMIQHEASHYGTWANYAAFGGFDTPKSWQTDWKL